MTGPLLVPAAERLRHRCDDLCVCPADGRPMLYAPALGLHACQDPECDYAHPDVTGQDEFDGCSRDCRTAGAHTLAWGACEHAVRPEPRLGFWRTFTASDGLPAIGQADIPLAALLPWVKHLTVDQRWQMLEEAADSDDPAAVIKRWKRRSDAKAPVQINMLPPREPGPGYGPGHLYDAYERGRRQGRYEAGG